MSAEAPDDLALVSLGPAGETVAEPTAAQLAAEAQQTARALLEPGTGKGDRIFIMLARVPAWYAVMLGAIRIGAVPMPGTNQLTSRDIAYRIKAAGAVAAVTDGAGADKVDEIDEDLPTLRLKLASATGRAPCRARRR